VPQGLAALSLDALASVAFGPEAIVFVLAASGSVGILLLLKAFASASAGWRS
jgi:hypothetical protein